MSESSVVSGSAPLFKRLSTRSSCLALEAHGSRKFEHNVGSRWRVSSFSKTLTNRVIPRLAAQWSRLGGGLLNVFFTVSNAREEFPASPKVANRFKSTRLWFAAVGLRGKIRNI